jgi:ABC-2 type transport system ATP-binding protein
VAEGTVAQLLQRNVSPDPSQPHIRTLTFEARPGLDFTGVFGPGIDVRESRAGSYSATGALSPEDLAALTAWWAARGIMPGSLSLEARSLEDVFLDISGRDIR